MVNPFKYTCLFGGGAIRGLAYVGAIRAMEELGIDFDIIGGSSVGSIFATLLACGYKSYELEKLFLKVNFELFRDIHFGFGRNIALSKGNIFEEWLEELIAKKIKCQNDSLTFKELEKTLVVITTNLKAFNTQEFSKNETPDFEISKAIRISSSMPGLMPPYKYNDADLVDGDLQKAAPMWKLAKTLNNSESRIIEFRLEGECDKNNRNPLAFINTIYSCVTDIATDFVSEIYGQNDRYDCIKINTGDIFFADFNLDKESRRKLICLGYDQTMRYFKEILPEKKRKLEEVYTSVHKNLKSIKRGLNMNDVEEVQWWIGDLFTTLCENKEIVDPNIYNQILEFKNLAKSSIKTQFFFHSKFKDIKTLKNILKTLLETIEDRITETRLYLQSL